MRKFTVYIVTIFVLVFASSTPGTAARRFLARKSCSFVRQRSASPGTWKTLPYNMQSPDGTPYSAAHVAMLRTGKLLLIAEKDTAETVLWDPTDEDSPQFQHPDNQPADFLFCSGHSFLSDGRLLVVGGGGNFVSNAINRAWKFDPVAGTNGEWSRTKGDMQLQRWYPTAVTLGYPNVLVAGGVYGQPVQQAEKLEVYSEITDEFKVVTGPPSNPTGADRVLPETYPGLHLLPNGKILYSQTGFGHNFLPSEPSPTAAYFEFTDLASATQGEWTDMTSNMHHPDRTEGGSVQILRPVAGCVEQAARVIVFGGGQPEQSGRAKVEAIDTAALSPGTSWTLLPDLAEPRFHASAVLLPNGKVLVLGGAEHGDNGTTGNKTTEVFDPASNTFEPQGKLEFGRGYHTVAALLPSGKVIVSGGISGAKETKIEIFSPAYLSAGRRPSIKWAPRRVHHGQCFRIATLQACEIEKVVFVRPMAFTHHTDSEQRVLQLRFSKCRNVLTVLAPGGNHPHPHAPRGYYMLFVLNTKGVPSVAKFVHLH